ncbi:hypothetical protein DFH08DRAFT_942575 [Mycena albidolilacea]|uniref:Uncharacterized protein n=1 Tax=Mycena albidolilacea TaxID=1033008 RepID=A0AAD7EET3_9AGAR|nr:hypothetical protein DFH08DRAFT_942575 [Mycena albidolilacea]
MRATYSASPHACYSARRHAGAHSSPDPHYQPHRQPVTPALVPHATFVASPGCATVVISVPPSRLDARACRALRYLPQHARFRSARHGRS